MDKKAQPIGKISCAFFFKNLRKDYCGMSLDGFRSDFFDGKKNSPDQEQKSGCQATY